MANEMAVQARNIIRDALDKGQLSLDDYREAQDTAIVVCCSPKILSILDQVDIDLAIALTTEQRSPD